MRLLMILACRCRAWLPVLLLMLLATPLAIAQVSTATLTGTVADQDKAIIPGAQVTIINRNNRFTRTLHTNSSGVFVFSSISWGDYDLTVSIVGFRTYALKAVHLDPGDTRTLALIELRVGEVSNSITVQSGGQNQVDDSGERSSLITSDDLQKLTLQGRDVTELLKILPGSAISTGNAGNQTATSNTVADSSNTQIGGAASGYSMSGSPTNGVSIRSDGANLTDPGTYSGGLQNINNEATAEVKVEQSNFGADTANGPLVINAVSKSGGTTYHGSIYVNGRTSQLNSTDSFLKRLNYKKPNDRFIYPGATFGGPVKIPGTDFNHNKHLTFFLQGEDLVQRNTYAYGNVSSAIQTALVPTAAMRAGDFSPASIAKYLPPGAPICFAHPNPLIGCPYPTDPNQLALYTQYENVHTVPISSYLGNAITCNGVAGDCLAPYLDAAAKAQFALIPLPNTANGQTTADGYNFAQLNLVPNDLYTAHTKIEFKPNDKQTLSFSYTAEYGNTAVPQANTYYAAGNSGAVNEPGGTVRNIHTNSLAFNYTTNFSSVLTNEFFVNAAMNSTFDSPRNTSLLNNGSIGYPPLSAFTNGTKQFPSLNDYGYDGLPVGIFADYSFGQFYTKTLVPGTGDNLTFAHGKHTFKVGFNLERPSVNNIQFNVGNDPTNGAVSNYYVSPTFTLPNDSNVYHNSCYGSSAGDQYCANSMGVSNHLADFEMGDFGQYLQSNVNPHLNMHQLSTSFYVNDDYKLTKRLTVNVGLRFDHLGRWTDAHGFGMAVWRPDLYSSDPVGNPAIPLPGFRWHGIDPSTPVTGYPTRALFYSPRLGMAFDVFGDGKTTLSGGWGMYRFHEGQNDFQNVLAVSNGLRTLTVNNPLGTNGQGLRASYINSIQASASPTNVSSTFSNQITNYATTTTPVYGLQAGDTESPLTTTYSMTVTQQFPAALTFSIGYAGNQSHDLLNDGANQQIFDDNVNAIPVGGLFQANPNQQSKFYGETYTAANIPGIPAQELNDYRPYKRYSQLQVVAHTLYANYNSLQVTLNRSKGFLSFGTTYTFSKALGVRGSYANGIPGDSFNMRHNYGPLSYDRSQIFNSYYDIQFGTRYKGSHELLRGSLNGWEISGSTFIQSGPNLQATNYLSNFNLTGTIPATADQQAYGVTNLTFLGTPDVSLQPYLTCDPRGNLAKHQYANASCFAIPTQGGNNGQFIYPYLHGPAYLDSDITAIKNFKMSDARNLQFRFAAFNFANHPLATFTNKAPTQTTLLFPLAANNNFGHTTFTAGRRTVEIGIKYLF